MARIEAIGSVYRRLKSAAVDCGMRGFSQIVEEALTEHFQSDRRREELIESIRAVEGAWSGMDVER